MKKLLLIISFAVTLIAGSSARAYNEDSFLIMPVEQTGLEAIYSGSAMRIEDERVGNRCVVEFDVTIPACASETEYKLAFNYTARDANNTEKIDICHASVATASGDAWKWIVSGCNVTVANNLLCNEAYRIRVAVDLDNRIQHCTIIKKTDNSVAGKAHNLPLRFDIPDGYTNLTVQHLRWYGSWVDTANETWLSAKPTSITIKRDAVYVCDKPIVTIGDGVVSASVTSYHNTYASANSPVLVLCIYDSAGTLVGVAASREAFGVKTSAAPVAKELTVSKEIDFNSGMTAKAMVINDFEGLLPFVRATEATYSGE